MEIVKRKVDIIFNEEEKQALEKVIGILLRIESQEDEIVEQIEEQFKEYRYPSQADNPTAIAVDYLGSLIKYGED